MTPKIVIEKCIAKSVSNGCQWLDGAYVEIWADEKIQVITIDGAIHDVEAVIFNREFAMALWGDDSSPMGLYDSSLGMPVKTTVEWKYQIQQMVISNNYYKYLAENVL